MFYITIGDTQYEIETSKSGFLINGEPAFPDIAKTGAGQWHIIYKRRSFNVDIVHYDAAAKKAGIRVNSRIYDIQLSNQYDKLLRDLGMQSTSASMASDLKAPMPGMVLKVLVNEGDTVEKGTPLLVLEAMKMENIIKSTTVGAVKSVHIGAGSKVEKNDLMISFA